MGVPSGLILLHKPAGVTSFDALRDIKKALGTGKAGHTGTLDKFAEGLLLVLIGRALKLSQWFTHLDKQYEGLVRFGAETDTLDPEGAVIAEAPVPEREAVEAALAQFRGDIEQAPPAYSAIHIDGERASALARRGEAPVMRKRPVHIYRLELLSWEPPFARIFVHCSSGTYIRSLARDIALAVGSRAHLTALVRTQVAGFKIENREQRTGNREQRTENREQGTENREQRTGNREQRTEKESGADCQQVQTESGGCVRLHPIDRNVIHTIGMACVNVSSAEAAKIIQGKSLEHIVRDTALPLEGNAAALFCGDELIAIIERSDNTWKYGYVYAHN